jgi:ABC-type branched-subunit amino acid transport system ATPase component
VSAPATAPAASPPLSLRQVGHRYGAGVIALSDISLDIAPGTLTLILGPNGAGKTTLANIGGGMLRPTSGEVRVWGRPAHYTESRAFNREGIVLVPERRRLFNRLTVRENIILGAYAVKQSRRQLEEHMRSTLALFPSSISERLQVPAGSLSGGEQQLLAVARALVAKPRLVILDEPSLGLAPRAIESVYELLAAAREGGTTLVVIEQSGAVALEYASDIVILDRGREVYRGAADSITQEQILEIGYVGHAESIDTKER